MLEIIFTLVVVGVVLYCVNAFVPMDPKIKTILNVVVVLIVLIWLFHVFGVADRLSKVRV